MFKRLLLATLLSPLIATPLQAGEPGAQLVFSDADNFWLAYDRIRGTADREQQRKYLDALYIDKATPGLKSLMQVRRYTPDQYLDAINNYPRFWQSIRGNIRQARRHTQKIASDVAALKALYPELKPANIYFAVGVFRTNGTIHDGNVLIGSEMALADKSVDVSEFPPAMQEFYTLYDPAASIGLLVSHEYVHTQQKEPADNLLSASLYEGIAEFVATLASGEKSYATSIPYEQSHHPQVRKQFETDMFVPSRMYNWLWSNKKVLEQRDLGYGVGVGIAKRYYDKARDKSKAIKELIELDPGNDAAVERLVDSTAYFSRPVAQLRASFDRTRPTVVDIEPFANHSRDVAPDLTRITLRFSEPMNPDVRGFDFGPLGEAAVLHVQNVIGFSEDRKSFTFEVKLEPGKAYQSVATAKFANPAGIPLMPYLIDFRTR